MMSATWEPTLPSGSRDQVIKTKKKKQKKNKKKKNFTRIQDHIIFRENMKILIKTLIVTI